MNDEKTKITKYIDTKDLLADEQALDASILDSANCIANGGLVAFPTETVYGLGADALNETAAKRIYAAKGRPSDNPLIVHIAKVEDVDVLAYSNETAKILAQSFWPGPLTIVLPKKDIVPLGTTGGLNTVAIRMPSHPAALSLIRQSGAFIAAPSANTSGRPSPTLAKHVVEDMDGKIEYIIDGGAVGIGIESTIVDLTGEIPTILRPGFITKKMLEDIVGTVLIDPALEKPLDGFKPKAPGMKYTHYAPKGELTLVEASEDESANVNPSANSNSNANQNESQNANQRVVQKICELANEKKLAGFRVGIMTSEEMLDAYEGMADKIVCVGKREERSTVAAHLYSALREFDEAGVDYIYAESFRGDGLSYAIMNRLLKAAGQRVLKI